MFNASGTHVLNNNKYIVPLFKKARKMPELTMGQQIGVNAAGMGLGLLGQAAGNLINQGYQRDMMQYQANIQKDLMKYQNAMALDMWNKTNYEAQRRHMEKAGLNVGLMYGKGGGGGATTGAGMPSGPSAPAGQQGMALQGIQTAMNLKMMDAEIKLKEAQARNLDSNSDTTNQSRETLIENMKQQGINTLQTNKMNAWLMSGTSYEGKDKTEYNHVYDYHVGIGWDSPYAQQIDTAILKTVAEKEKINAETILTNEKAKGYWTELLNATKQADASQIQAAAAKLNAELPGQVTNVKTWIELAKMGVDEIKALIKNK